MRTLILLLMASIANFSAACDLIESPKCPEDADHWVEYRLFMGRGGPDGNVVSDGEWDEFIAESATPRFPDGLTMLDGKGRWLGLDGEIQQESSKVLIILTASDDDDAEELIDQISAEYKRRFDQESVLKTVDQTCVAFQ